MSRLFGPVSSRQCKTESCALPKRQSRLCFCPGRSLPYPLPGDRLPDGCIPTCLFFESTSLCCISLVFLSLHGSSLCAAALSGCRLSGVFRSSTGRWSASRASSIRKGRGQSVLATRSLLICHLCSQSLPANGIFPGDSRSGAAGTSCALCAGSKPGCHAGTVSAYLPRHCARIPANQPGNLTAAQAIHVIFPYTTALFYAKKMAVHTVPSSGLVVWLLHSATGGLYELLFIFFCNLFYIL